MSEATAGQASRRMRVVAKSDIADGVVALRLVDADGGAVPTWEPGAHIDLELESDLVRQYSLCGDRADTGSLMVAVLREASGRGGSIYVHDKLEEGDLLEVGGPRNRFALIDAPSYLFVAGGIGITPLLPMLRQVERRGVAWRLLYGGRTRPGMAFADELVAAHPGEVDIRPQDEFGLLDIAGALDAAGEGVAVYCCGPEPLLLAVEAAGRERGLDVHVERFAPKAVAEDAVDAAFDVELSRTGTTVEVGASETIIDALERAGVSVEFSCREGTCGTCEVAVLGGEPDHRDSVLTDEEQAAGDAMMICVSRCRGSKLVLDL
ncbi:MULTISPECIES: PDR/VanB family oxidoreductase [Nocardia]|uniref:PDR/VanB family oxidoreductase n=1 Tax=Nocardia TaxID=1817 RepID=UPI001E5D8920|nr:MULTISPECIES: PDR/VanB family oxidoreductase [Nocardia]